MVEPASIASVSYGYPQPAIQVELHGIESAPIMVNREIDSGYWDYPIRDISNNAKMIFVSFFDWDRLSYRDNHYVRVQIREWSSHQDVEGKHGLIESQFVSFI